MHVTIGSIKDVRISYQKYYKRVGNMFPKWKVTEFYFYSIPKQVRNVWEMKV